MISDGEIHQVLVKSKDKGFELLFERYYKPLVLFAYEILEDNNAAEDIVQELFLKLWNKEYYKKVTISAFSSYLFGAVKNACYNKEVRIDILKNRKELDSFEILEQEASKLNEDLVKELKTEIDNLPERTKEVINLVFLNRMKYKDVACELDISVNTVKTLLRNGLNQLRVVFKDKAELFLFLLLNQ